MTNFGATHNQEDLPVSDATSYRPGSLQVTKISWSFALRVGGRGGGGCTFLFLLDVVIHEVGAGWRDRRKRRLLHPLHVPSSGFLAIYIASE